MKKSVVMFSAAVIAAVTHAETFTWTGAEDACWTNKANWTVGGAAASRCPSVTQHDTADENWVAWTNDADVARFDATGAARTTIDLDGLFSVKAIEIVGADAPAYTFGLEGQTLPMRADGTFTLDSTVTKAPVFVAEVAMGIGSFRTTSQTVMAIAYFVNNSSVQMRLGDMNVGLKNPDGAKGDYQWSFETRGTGPFALTGTMKDPATSNVRFGGYGLVTCEHDTYFKGFTMIQSDSKRTESAQLWINEGVTFGPSEQQNNGIVAIAYRGLDVAGPGTFLLRGPNPKYPTKPYASYLKMDGQQLAISSLFTVPDGRPLCLSNHSPTYQCTVAFTDDVDNQMTGDLVWDNAPYTVKASSIGANGVKSALGSGSDIRIAIDGTLAYTGAGEETTRTLTLTNTTSTSKAGGILSQQGTGPWTFSSTINPWYSSSSASATLGLDNATEFPATLNSVVADGPIALALKKTGAGLWTIAAANTYTGPTTVSAGTLALAAGGSIDASTSVTLAGGTELVVGVGAKTLKNLAVPKGTATLTLSVGAALTLDGAPNVANGAVLDIALPEGASLTCAALASSLPSYAKIRVNGLPATFDAQGKLTPGTYTPTTRVDVRGGVMASDADALIGFNDAGESGTVTLGSATVQAAAVVQDLETAPATVTFAAGQTLSPGILALNAGAANLTIGADRTTGALGVTSSGLFIDNSDTDATLAVRAPLGGSGTLTIGKAGVGLADLPLGSTFTAALSLVGGTLGFSDGDGTAFGLSRPEDAEKIPSVTLANTAAAGMTLTQADAEGAVDVSGTITETKKMKLTVSAGEVRLTGKGTKGLGVVSVAADGVLKMDGGAEVLSYGTDKFTVNGRFEIAGATNRNTTAGADNGEVEKGAIVVRNGGLLVVGADAVVSNRLVVGYPNGGAVKQTNGTVWAMSSSGGSSKNCSNIGYDMGTGASRVCHPGYYLKTGGTLKAPTYFWLNDGLFEHADGETMFHIFSYAGIYMSYARPHLLITGGTINVSDYAFNMGWQKDAMGQNFLTVDGEDAALLLSYSAAYTIKMTGSGAMGMVNLNKGRIRASQFYRSSGLGYVNFNGGTYVCTVDNNGQNIFNSITRVTVYEGGVTIDLNDKRNCKLNEPMLAAPGNGVEAVSMTATTGWTAVPSVDFEGDGEGASACVKFDPETGTVSGIRITSRGYNYTHAEAVLKVSGVEKARYACTLSPNKRGPLTIMASVYERDQLNFYLTASNEVSKLIVDAGMVNVRAAGAVPADAELVVNAKGGYNGINFGDYPARIGALGGTPNNGRIIGNVTNALGQLIVTMDHPSALGLTGTLDRSPMVMTAVGKWELTPTQIVGWNTDPANPTCPVYGWSYAFADTASVVVSTPEGLDEDVCYTIFKVADGKTLTGMPSFAFADGQDHDWKLRKRGNSLVLKHQKGLMLIVR